MNVRDVGAALLQTAKEQVFSKQGTKSQAWRAYTSTGKIVVILDKQVIDIIDPTKKLPVKVETRAP